MTKIYFGTKTIQWTKFKDQNDKKDKFEDH